MKTPPAICRKSWICSGGASHCGAIIDPWNILGFDANFSLFPALENSVRDHRADELVALMDRVLALLLPHLERSGCRR